MAQHKESIKLEATKGFMPMLKKLIPYIVSVSLLGGSGGIMANDINELNSRLLKIEQVVADNTLEINGQKIELKNYNARIVELQEDVRESRNDIKQILIILQKK